MFPEGDGITKVELLPRAGDGPTLSGICFVLASCATLEEAFSLEAELTGGGSLGALTSCASLEGLEAELTDGGSLEVFCLASCVTLGVFGLEDGGSLEVFCLASCVTLEGATGLEAELTGGGSLEVFCFALASCATLETTFLEAGRTLCFASASCVPWGVTCLEAGLTGLALRVFCNACLVLASCMATLVVATGLEAGLIGWSFRV